MTQMQRSFANAADSVVFVDFFLSENGQGVDHIATSLPPEQAKKLPATFRSAQEGRSVLTPLLVKMQDSGRRAPFSICYTNHPYPYQS